MQDPFEENQFCICEVFSGLTTMLSDFLFLHGVPHLSCLVWPFELFKHVQVVYQDACPGGKFLHPTAFVPFKHELFRSSIFFSHRDVRCRVAGAKVIKNADLKICLSRLKVSEDNKVGYTAPLLTVCDLEDRL